VNVVSGGLYGVRLDVGALVEPPRPFSGVNAYAQAKRALLLETARLDAAWSADGVRVHAMHPGWADTPGVRSSLPRFYRVTKPWLRTPFAGIDTAVWLALTNPAPGGRLWFDRRIASDHLLARTRETDDDRARLADLFDRACG
jgi:dehydrogenase/reductase SDR family member 12